jgi:hypothetical protein
LSTVEAAAKTLAIATKVYEVREPNEFPRRRGCQGMGVRKA